MISVYEHTSGSTIMRLSLLGINTVAILLIQNVSTFMLCNCKASCIEEYTQLK